MPASDAPRRPCLWCDGPREALRPCTAPRLPGSRWCVEHQPWATREGCQAAGRSANTVRAELFPDAVAAPAAGPRKSREQALAEGRARGTRASVLARTGGMGSQSCLVPRDSPIRAIDRTAQPAGQNLSSGPPAPRPARLRERALAPERDLPLPVALRRALMAHAAMPAAARYRASVPYPAR
jgi:hypothetical protein